MDKVKQGKGSVSSVGAADSSRQTTLLNIMIKSGLTEKWNLSKNLKQVKEFAYSLWRSGRIFWVEGPIRAKTMKQVASQGQGAIRSLELEQVTEREHRRWVNEVTGPCHIGHHRLFYSVWNVEYCRFWAEVWHNLTF